MKNMKWIDSSTGILRPSNWIEAFHWMVLSFIAKHSPRNNVSVRKAIRFPSGWFILEAICSCFSSVLRVALFIVPFKCAQRPLGILHWIQLFPYSNYDLHAQAWTAFTYYWGWKIQRVSFDVLRQLNEHCRQFCYAYCGQFGDNFVKKGRTADLSTTSWNQRNFRNKIELCLRFHCNSTEVYSTHNHLFYTCRRFVIWIFILFTSERWNVISFFILSLRCCGNHSSQTMSTCIPC